jgi:hypothetical protein
MVTVPKGVALNSTDQRVTEVKKEKESKIRSSKVGRGEMLLAQSSYKFLRHSTMSGVTLAPAERAEAVTAEALMYYFLYLPSSISIPLLCVCFASLIFAATIVD